MEISTTLARRLLGVVTAAALALPAMAAAQPAPPDPAAVRIDPGARREVVASLAAALRDHFAFPEKGAAAAARIEALERGGAFAADDAAELTAELMRLAGPIVDDRHFRIRYVGPEVTAQFREGPPPPEEVAAFQEEVRLRGHEIPRAEWLPGNVGYLKVTMLFPPDAVGAKLDAAMRFLADTDALIIDVRGTPGGSPEGVANLVGYLVGERTRLLDVIDPRGISSRSFHAEPKPGAPSFAGKPVFVLIDGDTGSGAEELAYDLQAMKRATLVGETTYGAANPGGFRPLAHGFAAFIPMQRVANAVTGTNWEGVGVKPDIAASSVDALRTAHRAALEAVIAGSDGLRRELAQQALAEAAKPAT